MSLVLGHVTTNPAEAVVLMSKLKAGGFHPVLFNQFHGMIAIAHIQALGGYRIMIPRDEVADARDFMQNIDPITDYDPIPSKAKQEIIRGSVLFLNPLYGLWHLSPMILFIVWCAWVVLLWMAVPQSLLLTIVENIILLYLIGMLAHAKRKSSERALKE